MRVLLNSDPASVYIPELVLELRPGALGAHCTALEDILHDISAQPKRCSLARDDSRQQLQRAAMNAVAERLDGMPSVQRSDAISSMRTSSQCGLLADQSMRHAPHCCSPFSGYHAASLRRESSSWLARSGCHDVIGEGERRRR